MATSNVTPISPAKARTRAKSPSVTLLAAAAGILTFAGKAYEHSDFSDLHDVVRNARDLVWQWCDEHEDLDYSDELYDALGLLMMADMALEADLESNSSRADPYRATLSAAADLLRRAVARPTEAS